MTFVQSIPPTGVHTVLRKDLILEDRTRWDPHCPKQKRVLPLNIFYPSKTEGYCLSSYDQGALAYWRQADYWASSQRNLLESSLQSFRCYTGMQSVGFFEDGVLEKTSYFIFSWLYGVHHAL